MTYEDLPGAAGSHVKEDTDLLICYRGNGETDTATKEGAFVKGITPLEGDLNLSRRDLLLQGCNLVIVAERCDIALR